MDIVEMTSYETSNSSEYSTIAFTNGSISDNDTEVEFLEDEVSTWLWRIIPVPLFLLGMTGNFLCVLVLARIGLKRKPTLVIICFLAVTDSVVLATGLSKYWIENTFDVNVRLLSNAGCKVNLFVIYISMQYSAWTLVLMTTERLFKTYFPFRYKRIFKVKIVIIAQGIIFVILTGIDGHLFFTNGLTEDADGERICDSLNPKFHHFDEFVFVYIDFVTLSVLPFLIMLICNIFLARTLKGIQRNRASMMHNSVWRRTQRVSVRLTKMLMFTTVYFLVATVPNTCYFIADTYLRPSFENTGNDHGSAILDLIWTVTYLLLFSNFAVNFYLYTFSNNKFRNHLRVMFGLRSRGFRRSRISAYSMNNRGTVSSTESPLETEFTETLGFESQISNGFEPQISDGFESQIPNGFEHQMSLSSEGLDSEA